MKTFLLLLGLAGWLLVFVDFALAFRFRRSELRFIWWGTSLGWPFFFIRELAWVGRDTTWAMAMLGIVGGLAFGFLLVVRWLNNPEVLK